MAAILSVIFGILLSLTASTYGGVQSKAGDTKRQTDIKSVETQLEAYFAQNGYYPTLTNMNSRAWLAQNMRGLDTQALKDPDGSGSLLAAKPGKHVYSYQVSGTNGKACNNVTVDCTKFILTARLSDGTPYAVESLN